MSRIAALLLLVCGLWPMQASAQSGCPSIAYGAVLTAAQWNQCFASKVDYTGSAALTGILANSPITASTGGSIVTVGLNVGVNFNFTSAQTININGTALQAAQTGTVLQLANANGVSTRVEADAYAASAHFSGVRADGTAASPTTLQSGDNIASFNAFGYNGSAFVGPQAAFRCYAAQNWTTGPAYGTYCDVAVTANGGSTLAESVRFENDGGLTLPSTVTGGDKGAGTINAAGLYVNGTAVLTASASSITVGTTTVASCSNSGYILYNNGGTLGCEASTGAPGGSNTQVQYNNSSAFAGISGVTSDGTKMTFATGDLIINGASATAGLATVTSGGVVSSEANATVAQGGTGVASLTADALIVGGTTTTGAVQSIANVATGEVLTSQGTGTNIPAFSATPTLGVVSATSGTLALANSSSSHLVTLASGNNSAAWTMTLPITAGTNTYVLQTDGSGNTSWVAQATVLTNFIGGLTLSNDGGTPNSILDIAAGEASDTTNAVTISIGAFTKSTGGAWTSGTGNNGMGNGLTIANTTWYYVCLANNGGTADIWFDTAAACTNRPAGISDAKYRRIGAFKTDSSAHILGFIQNGSTFLWKAKFASYDYTAVNPGTGLVTTTVIAAPTGIKTEMLTYGALSLLTPGTASLLRVWDPDTPNYYTGGGIGAIYLDQQQAITIGSQIRVWTNASGQIDTQLSFSDGNTTVYIQGYGYIDPRGQ